MNPDTLFHIERALLETMRASTAMFYADTKTVASALRLACNSLKALCFSGHGTPQVWVALLDCMKARACLVPIARMDRTYIGDPCQRCLGRPARHNAVMCRTCLNVVDKRMLRMVDADELTATEINTEIANDYGLSRDVVCQRKSRAIRQQRCA